MLPLWQGSLNLIYMTGTAVCNESSEMNGTLEEIHMEHVQVLMKALTTFVMFIVNHTFFHSLIF